MSNNKDNLAKELFDALNEVIFFLNEHHNREIAIIQTRILLNSKKDLVIKNLNAFSNEVSLDQEYKIGVIFKVLDLATQIIYRIPRVPELDRVRLDYQSLTNFVRMLLAYIHQDNSQAQSFSTASILSHMLLDEVPNIEELPELPPFDEDPFPFFEIAIPLSNSFQSNFGIYETLIDFLPTVTRSNMIEWVNKMLLNFKLHWKLFAKFDILIMLKTKKIKKMNNFINNIFIFIFTQMGMVLSLLELHAKFGGMWPEEIDNLGMVKKFSLEEFTRAIKENEDFVLGKINDLKHAYSIFLIDRNDNPEMNENMADFKIYLDDFHFQQKLINLYHFNEFNEIKKIDEIKSNGMKFLEAFIDQAGGTEEILSSTLLSSFLISVHEVLPFITRSALLHDDHAIFENFQYEYRSILNKLDIEDDANLFWMNTLCTLIIETHFDYDVDIDQKIGELEATLQYFLLKPRIYLSMSNLLIILSFLSNKKDGEYRFEILKKIEYNDILGENRSKTKQDFNHYKQFLFAYEKGENFDLMLTHRQVIIDLDHMSWLIPDFTKWFEQKNKYTIPYIPFNLAMDALIEM
ncbi:MAG: hypothetical protein INQ03_13440 [Candidatus Heimdallarchaeota archaeon]|nr:hypothetical protein [Candidatus Heimdallarchaeota archaeon]